MFKNIVLLLFNLCDKDHLIKRGLWEKKQKIYKLTTEVF